MQTSKPENLPGGWSWTRWEGLGSRGPAHLCRAPSWHSGSFRMPGSFALCNSIPPKATRPNSPCSGRPGGPPVSLSSSGYRWGTVSIHAVSAWDSQPADPGLWAPGCQDAGQEALEEASWWTNTGTAVLGLKPGSQPGSPKGHLKASKDEHLLQRLETNRTIRQPGKKIRARNPGTRSPTRPPSVEDGFTVSRFGPQHRKPANDASPHVNHVSPAGGTAA